MVSVEWAVWKKDCVGYPCFISLARCWVHWVRLLVCIGAFDSILKAAGDISPSLVAGGINNRPFDPPLQGFIVAISFSCFLQLLCGEKSILIVNDMEECVLSA